MRIVLLGAPGCGKGTQGHRLAESYKVPEISTGDLLREAVAAGTALGRAAKAVMDAGQLVSDEIVLGVIRERLTVGDTANGFILDGFPRNVAQAEQLDELLDQLGQPIDIAVLIEVDVDMILQRLLGRRTCVSCGASYNIFYAPPRMDDSCDECGGRLKRRGDDNEETIGNRLRVYEMQTLPVIDRYREQGRLRVVQGLGDIDDIFKAVSKAIEEARATFDSVDRSAAIRRAVARKQLVQPEEPEKAENKPSVTVLGVSGGVDQVAGKSALKTKPTERAGKKSVVKKAAAKKKAAKKPISKKTAVKKKATKKAAVKKKVAKKTAAKKKAVKKTVVKKAVAKKKAAKKKVAKKSAAKRKVAKKAAAGVRAAKKPITRKTVKKKAAKKKAGRKSLAAPARKKVKNRRTAARRR